MKSNTPQTISTCIASQQMENSESRQKVISLGKSLIAEFNEETSTDTLTRWLVHYIAEQIELISSSIGEEKIAAEQRCVDVILKLWSNRSVLPNGLRPFENFDSIMRGLSKLDHQSPRYYYNEYSQFDHNIDSEVSSETKKWVNKAIKIDEGARALVDESFKIAASHAMDEKTRDILNHTINTPGDDLRLIIKLAREYDEQSSEEELIEMRKNELNTKLDRLNNMIKVCNEFSELIQNELAK